MNQTAKRLLEVFGWYGTISILVAYLLISFGMARNLVLYQILNFTGSVGLSLIAVMRKAWQPAVLEIAWAFIALASLGFLIFVH